VSTFAEGDQGVEFKALQQGAIDTTTSGGRLMLNMLAAVAEFETDLRRERQMEGIARKQRRQAPIADVPDRSAPTTYANFERKAWGPPTSPDV
jgi:DNA invertase Pin-like site-specific DNA recombinase